MAFEYAPATLALLYVCAHYTSVIRLRSVATHVSPIPSVQSPRSLRRRASPNLATQSKKMFREEAGDC